MSKSNSLRILLGALFLIGFAVVLVLHYGGTLARDVALNDQSLVPHPTARVLSAKCTNHYLLVSACSVEYDDPTVAKPTDKFRANPEFSYLMFGSLKGERVLLMRVADGTAVATSSTGMIHLTNRIVTLLILVGLLCGFVPILMLIKLRTGGIPPAPADRSLTADSVDAAIAKRALAQNSAPAGAAPPAYQAGGAARATFGQRRFSQ